MLTHDMPIVIQLQIIKKEYALQKHNPTQKKNPKNSAYK